MHTVMAMKTLISLLLGLAFQLAQVLPGVVVTAPCAAAGVEACKCDACGKSCCCAKSGQPVPKPLPLPFSSKSLFKGMAMQTATTRVAAHAWHDLGPVATLAAAPHSAPPAGFAGVRLAVAFCSFVI